MKNIILGIIGVCVILYTFFSGLDILTFQTSKNEMEKHVSRILENILEAEYQTGDVEAVKQTLTQEITSAISKNDTVKVEVLAIDLEKGLLSIKVTKQIGLFNGKKREIAVEKTAIIERTIMKDFEPEVS